jgi:hypothetical protein
MNIDLRNEITPEEFYQIRKSVSWKEIGKLIIKSIFEDVLNDLENDELFQIEATPTLVNRDFLC